MEVSRWQTKIELWHVIQQVNLSLGILNKTLWKLLRSLDWNYLLYRVFVWLALDHTACFFWNFYLCSVTHNFEPFDWLVDYIWVLLPLALSERLYVYLTVISALVRLNWLFWRNFAQQSHLGWVVSFRNSKLWLTIGGVGLLDRAILSYCVAKFKFFLFWRDLNLCVVLLWFLKSFQLLRLPRTSVTVWRCSGWRRLPHLSFRRVEVDFGD